MIFAGVGKNTRVAAGNFLQHKQEGERSCCGRAGRRRALRRGGRERANSRQQRNNKEYCGGVRHSCGKGGGQGKDGGRAYLSQNACRRQGDRLPCGGVCGNRVRAHDGVLCNRRERREPEKRLRFYSYRRRRDTYP